MESWARVLSLTVGGALGVNARYWLGVALGGWDGRHWPWATFLINVSGSFLIGLLGPVVVRHLPHPHGGLFVLTGLLGGYTTFSTFTLEALSLVEKGHPLRAGCYVVVSVLLGILAVWVGLALGRTLAAPTE